ncbi:7-carboxy-7-deazaguanine synthase QueE [Hydrogenimonas sp. SS33]|uniref:7-carboxy-7-deazaguanine synthase QueE n=1 Tax=Hydrogenimonas leucolamina TaxID=2954236 RepID=UPI00336C2FAA
MIYLVEHFFSIQGEGRYSGVPSIFIRFGGCNLRCPGFGSYEIAGKTVRGCDTIRAVDSGLFRERWREIASTDMLIKIVEAYMESIDYRPDVVITGGEPMIYAENPIFYGFIQRLAAEGFRVTVETNATLAPPFEAYPVYREVIFAMAVKLANSGEPERRRIVPGVIRRLAKEGKDSFFKFTVDKRSADEGAAEEIAEICDGFDNEIYCMPLGDRLETLQLHAPAVAAFCLREGYRYSDRLHVRLWNREEKR